MENFLELMNAVPATWATGLEIKIGLISNGGTEPLAHMLTVLLSRLKIKARVHYLPLSSYLHPTEEFLKSHEALGLRFVILLPLTQELKLRYYQATERENLADEVWKEFEVLLKHLGRSQLLVANFVCPPERILDSLVMELNERLKARANQDSNLTMVDLDRMAADLGRRDWFDQRSWIISRLPCSPTMLPQLAQIFSRIISSRVGQIIKCIVLDADQMLWPEIVDEVGAQNVLNPENPECESFIEFQYYLLELAQRGIMLAVCSKNEIGDIKKIFSSHSRMVLNEKAISSFQVSWKDKAEGLKNISRDLNIGMDSLLFLDDSAFEREFVRRELPEVLVPEISTDPTETIRVLSELNLFEGEILTAEDRLRNSQIVRVMEKNVEQLPVEEFLLGLKMKGVMRLAGIKDLPRLAQLFQRANQFNMMTRRYSQQEVAGILDAKESHIVTLELGDRLGELGIISALILRREDQVLEISDWVLSCRAFSRNIEQSLLFWLSDRAQKMGCLTLRGLVIPNERNLIATEFYKANGFERMGETRPECWEHELPYSATLSFALKVDDDINEDLWKKKFFLN